MAVNRETASAGSAPVRLRSVAGAHSGSRCCVAGITILDVHLLQPRVKRREVDSEVTSGPIEAHAGLTVLAITQTSRNCLG